MEKKKCFEVFLDRIEENIAVLQLEGGKSILIPVKYMPENIVEGERYIICIEREN